MRWERNRAAEPPQRGWKRASRHSPIATPAVHPADATVRAPNNEVEEASRRFRLGITGLARLGKHRVRLGISEMRSTRSGLPPRRSTVATTAGH
uniref:Uncharacterized protein n=1 Tax=Arundo donax TaxID=35708 RepID=A0A0A9H1N4_ARUDO